jgi:formylglycine-generating enzyme required for sulfatase activity
VREYGTLAIRGKLAGIEVWLDDRKLGVTQAGTALVMSNVPAGSYTLKAKRAGYKDWERDVQVAANQRAEVLIDIEPLRPEPPPAAKSEDGAEMVLVPAGEFWMGSDNRGDESPRHRVYLDGFYIDKVPVTNALYERFMRATSRQQPWYWTDRKFNGPTQPVVGVSWHDADAYCRWAGKRLLTEAEWEKAARGTDGREYPWGDQWDPSRANSLESKLDRTTTVGSYPSGASPYGALDMAGNVWQWVADWYDKDYYQRSPARNPTGPESGQPRVLRGGSWGYNPVDLRSAYRFYVTPGNRNLLIGFRCARGQ